MALGIEDYALIGDCETAALVGRDGSLDWLCWPRFDSGACFAALLGTAENGRWLICPRGEVQATRRRYRDDTLILETEFETEEGAVALIDFMPPRGTNSDVVRIVEGRRGRVAMCCEIVIRFDYGATVPWVSRLEDGTRRAIAGPDMLALRTEVDLRGENLRTVGEFTVGPGERVPFVLTQGPSHLPPPEAIDPFRALDETEAYWHEWTARCADAGEWSSLVRRSLITLKALTFAPTGGIAAAATTSLPEQPGGTRNWDYRYCWLRDSAFTLLALIHGGFTEEATAWRDWLIRAAAGSPEQLQIMYGIAGERRLFEWEVEWLPGYQGARPVRIGNAASTQRQLDIYGEVADVLYQSHRAGVPRSEEGRALGIKLIEHVEEIWREPDHGIWEVRGPPQHFVHSKVMAWVALDRAVKTHEIYGRHAGSVERWRACRAEICADILRHGFDPELGSFVQAYGSKQVDAALLLIPLVGFLPADDPRVRGTIAAIERMLLRDGFVLRYDTTAVEDGLPPGEGHFLPCSFWYVDNLCLAGRHDEARRLFARLAGLVNDVGLLSEEYDSKTGRFLGNFPQAFSHVALVNSALNLMADGPARKRAESSD